MYFSRGNPVVYYGDEQGFTGDGGDQLARQDMFPSQVPEYNDDDLIGTDATTADSNFDRGHPLYRSIAKLAALTRERRALSDGAQQHRYSSDGTGIYEFSRIGRKRQREYVVALNNAEEAKTAAIPTYVSDRRFKRVYGDGPAERRSGDDARLELTVPALSAVVYKLAGRIERSDAAPSIALEQPEPAAESRARMQVRADVGGDSFYEVTFQADTGDGWKRIGTDDNAPYRVFHDVSALHAGAEVRYRAIVLDNARHTRMSAVRIAEVPAPAVTIEAPREGALKRGAVEVRAVADPERATHVVDFERSIAGGPWTVVGSDSSSPVYTLFDDLAPLALAPGTRVSYRAVLHEPDGTTVTSAERSIVVAGPKVDTAVVHYFRPAGDYDSWGLHMWGDAVADSVLAQIPWDRPWQRSGVDANGWARYDVPLDDDTEALNFIMHTPSGDSVPETREPGGDRSFFPASNPEIWLNQGDPTIYTSQPATG
jgi:alpha-amylase